MKNSGVQADCRIVVGYSHAVGTEQPHIVFIDDSDQFAFGGNSLAADLAEAGGNTDDGFYSLLSALFGHLQYIFGGHGNNRHIQLSWNLQNRSVAGCGRHIFAAAVYREGLAAEINRFNVFYNGMSYSATGRGSDNGNAFRPQECGSVAGIQRLVFVPALDGNTQRRSLALVKNTAIGIAAKVAHCNFIYGA